MLGKCCALCRQGDVSGTCKAFGSIGTVHEKMGDHSAALNSLSEQLRLAEEQGDTQQQAVAMGNLGITCRSLGRHDEAVTLFEGQLNIAQRTADVAGQIQAFGNLSVVSRKLGRNTEFLLLQETEAAVADKRQEEQAAQDKWRQDRKNAAVNKNLEILEQDALAAAAAQAKRLEQDNVWQQENDAMETEQAIVEKRRFQAERAARKLDRLCQKKLWSSALLLEPTALRMGAEEESSHPRLALVLYGRLALVYEQGDKNGSRLESAVDMHSKVYALAAVLGDYAMAASACTFKAHACALLGDYASSASARVHEIAALERGTDLQAQLNACVKLAEMFERLGRHVNLLDVTRKLLVLAEKLGDKATQGSALTVMEQALSKIGRHAEASQIRLKARTVQTQALQYYTAHMSSGNAQKQALACVKLAVVYQDLGRHTEAIDMRAKAKSLQARLANPATAPLIKHPAEMPFFFPSRDDDSDDDDLEEPELFVVAVRKQDADQDTQQIPTSEEPGQHVKIENASLESAPAEQPTAPGAPDQDDLVQNTPAPTAESENLVPTTPVGIRTRADHRHRSLVGPTPMSSPAMHPHNAPEADAEREAGGADTKRTDAESQVLALMHLCQNKEWEKAAGMHPRMLRLAGELVGSEPRMAAAIYGNLGFVFESLAEHISHSDTEAEPASQELWMQAISMHEQARQIACSTQDVLGEANACSHLGVAHTAVHRFEEAIEMLNRCFEVAQELEDHAGACQSLGKLGNVHFLLSDFSLAIEVLHKQLALAETMADDAGQAATCGNLGAVYSSLSRHSDAVEMFQKHLVLAQKLGDVEGQAQTCSNLAISFEHLGRHAEAIECLSNQRDLTKLLGDEAGQAEAAGRLGLALIATSCLDKAILFLSESLELLESCGLVEQQAQTLQTIGMLSLGLGHYTKADECLTKAKAIAIELNKQAALGKICTNLGIVKLRLGSYVQALELHLQAQSIAIELADVPAQATAAGNLGVCRAHRGQEMSDTPCTTRNLSRVSHNTFNHCSTLQRTTSHCISL